MTAEYTHRLRVEHKILLTNAHVIKRLSAISVWWDTQVCLIAEAGMYSQLRTRGGKLQTNAYSLYTYNLHIQTKTVAAPASSIISVKRQYVSEFDYNAVNIRPNYW